MPYSIKPFNNGYYVFNKKTGRVFSKDPLTLAKAQAQQKYLTLHTLKGGNETDLLYSGGSDFFKKIRNVFTNEYSPTLDSFEKKYKNWLITRTIVGRTPVQSFAKKALEIVSNGKFVYYDEIYHLFIILELKSPEGKIDYIRLEKSPNILIKNVKSFYDQDANLKQTQGLIPYPIITFGELVTKIKESEGENLFKYTPEKYNCQQFILTIAHTLRIKGFDSFIQQEGVGELLKSLGTTKAVANSVTSIGHLFNRVLGRGYDLSS